MTKEQLDKIESLFEPIRAKLGVDELCFKFDTLRPYKGVESGWSGCSRFIIMAFIDYHFVESQRFQMSFEDNDTSDWEILVTCTNDSEDIPQLIEENIQEFEKLVDRVLEKSAKVTVHERCYFSLYVPQES